MERQVSDTDPWILLIDDDKEFSRALDVYLKKLGINLVATSTVEDFAGVVRAKLPTVCLVDLNINGLLAGFALITGLRKKFGPDLPLMIISATNDISSIMHGIECGADDYITKPINLQELNSKLEKFINAAVAPAQVSKFTRAPSGGEEALLGFEVRVKAVDELMIQVICPHFLCKGTPANFFGDLVEQAFPDKKKALGSVTGCELMADGDYLVSLEFVEMAEPEQASLRKFVSPKASSSAD